MSNKNDNTGKMIVGLILGGIILLVALAIFFKKDVKVTLPIVFEEYTDFQCPACAAYYPVVQDLVSKYSTDNVSFVFKNYPLTSIHTYSYTAHLAGYAAKQQGAFENYASLLFKNQDKLTVSDLLAYATSLNLNIDMFTTDMHSTAAKAAVDADMADGEAKGINSTPTFYINGEEVVFKDSDNPETVLRTTLDNYIAKAISQAK